MHSKFVATAALIAGLVSASVASAQNVPADLTKARGERAEALAKGDRAVFDKLTTENFIVIDAQGRVESKTERAARVTPPANPPQNPPPTRVNEKVSMYNNNAAVATWDQNVQGAPLHFMEVWVKDKGTWKCAAANVNRPSPAPARGGEGGGEGRRGGRRGEGQ